MSRSECFEAAAASASSDNSSNNHKRWCHDFHSNWDSSGLLVGSVLIDSFFYHFFFIFVIFAPINTYRAVWLRTVKRIFSWNWIRFRYIFCAPGNFCLKKYTSAILFKRLISFFYLLFLFAMPAGLLVIFFLFILNFLCASQIRESIVEFDEYSWICFFYSFVLWVNGMLHHQFRF